MNAGRQQPEHTGARAAPPEPARPPGILAAVARASAALAAALISRRAWEISTGYGGLPTFVCGRLFLCLRCWRLSLKLRRRSAREQSEVGVASLPGDPEGPGPQPGSCLLGRRT